MITGDNLVNYLCDSGADKAIINENLFNKIKSVNANKAVVPYNAKLIQSCSGEIKVFGTITVSQLIINPNKILKSAKLIATNHTSKYPCILGTDLINDIPKLKSHLYNIKDAVNSITNEVKSYFSKINREKNSNKIGKIDKSEKIEEYLSIYSLSNTYQKTSDNEEKIVI